MKIQRQTYDIKLYRGDTIREELQVLGVSQSQSSPDTLIEDQIFNLTNYTLKAQIRRIIDGPIVEELVCSVTNASRGEIVVTTAIPVGDIDLGPDLVGVWDLQIMSNEATPKVYTAFLGQVTYMEDVTHS